MRERGDEGREGWIKKQNEGGLKLNVAVFLSVPLSPSHYLSLSLSLHPSLPLSLSLTLTLPSLVHQTAFVCIQLLDSLHVSRKRKQLGKKMSDVENESKTQ